MTLTGKAGGGGEYVSTDKARRIVHFHRLHAGDLVGIIVCVNIFGAVGIHPVD